MSFARAPGLSFEPVQPLRPAGPLARADIACFFGYTTRGPALTPVRIGSATGFADLFGDPPETGALADAVKGFFESGGSACYVVRVVDASAAAAEAINAGWRISASFPWGRIDPRALAGAEGPEIESWAGAHEAATRESRRAPDPGAWGNGLSVAFRRSSLAATQTVGGVIEEGWACRVESLAGVESASVLQLHQDAPAGYVEATVGVEAVDAARQIVRWRTRPADLGFDPTVEIRIVSVEFDVTVRLDGRETERFEKLAPDPAHSRSLNRTIRDQSHAIALTPPAAADWGDPAAWPAEGAVALSGGRDGVSAVAAEHYLAGLAAAARVEEIALLAAPDLTLATEAPPPPAPAPAPAPDCAILDAPPPARLRGVVRATATDGPLLRGAQVAAAGGGAPVETDALGRFEIAGLPPGLATLRLSKPGYAALDTQAEAREDAALETFVLSPLETPRRLDDSEILAVQQAMTTPALAGPYRVAVLDPPRPDMTLSDLRSWRAKLGDTQRGGFYVPWLKTPGGRETPPCGHVCGVIAEAEHRDGAHRAGANLGLRHADGVTLSIGEAEHALLNPAGINAIRAFPGRGVRVYGARSLSSDPEWRFLTTRRLIDVIEKTLERSLQWAVFEPNGPVTRQAIVFAISALLNRIWRAGALAGTSAAAAYRVASDVENNPQAAVDAGRLIADVAVAPAVPFEFIHFRLGRALDAIEVTE